MKFVSGLFRSTFNQLKAILFVVVIVLYSGCKNKIDVKINNAKKIKSTDSLNVTVSKIEVINHQIIITGTESFWIVDQWT